MGSKFCLLIFKQNQLPGPGSYYDDLNKVTKFGPREESVGKKGLK